MNSENVRPQRENSRRGDALWLLISTLIVVFVLGMSLSYIYRQQVREISRHSRKIQAYYVASSGIQKGLFHVKELLRKKLVDVIQDRNQEELIIQEELLNLLDVDKARGFSRVYTFEGQKDGLPDLAQVQVTLELINLTRNPFSTHIDRVEKIPSALEPYREKRDDDGDPIPGALPLGGWSAHLRVTARSTYQSQSVVLEQVRDIRIIDISPPAPDHTIFIHGKQTEYLKQGKFVLSNLELPESVLELIHKLTIKLNEILRIPEISGNRADVLSNVEVINQRLNQTSGDADPGDALEQAYALAQHASDENIKDMVDNIILSLNPRDWGRVRTNGVLQIDLPFFAPDDIINYFADTSIFGHQRPEIGYHNCYNRLHDPYLSVYTHYEGYVYKNYRRLNPLVLGPSNTAQVVPPQRYTINTRMNYVLRYPDREEVPNLSRLEKFGQKYSHRLFKAPVTLIGTERNPIRLAGIWYSQEDVTLGGPYTGRGLIISEKNIIISSDLTPVVDGQDSLGLVALKSQVQLGKKVGRTIIHAAIYAQEGLSGSQSTGVNLFGNLAVENLYRDRMPRWFFCRFNPHIKNHMVDNLHGTVSQKILWFKILSDQTQLRAI